jgi:hypothetical protein
VPAAEAGLLDILEGDVAVAVARLAWLGWSPQVLIFERDEVTY